MSTKPTEDRLLTLDEVAERLGISRSSVYYHRATLEAVPEGPLGGLAIWESALQKALDDGRIRSRRR